MATPLTVTASDSISYHLWQLSMYSSPEPEDTTTYDAIENTLTDGFRMGIRTGFNAGTKSWRLAFPSLAAGEIPVPSVTGPGKETVSREQYVRDVYADNKVTSTPFVLADPQSGTYYFVDFEDKTLSMKRARIKLYTTGLTMIQRRIPGVYIP